eukprot:gene20253-47436_t
MPLRLAASAAQKYGVAELATHCAALLQQQQGLPMQQQGAFPQQPVPAYGGYAPPPAPSPPPPPPATECHFAPLHAVPDATEGWLHSLRAAPSPLVPEELEAEKGGARIAGALRFGTQAGGCGWAGRRASVPITAVNHGSAPLLLAGCGALPCEGDPAAFGIDDAWGLAAGALGVVCMPPGGSAEVRVHFQSTDVGRHAAWVVFSFVSPTACFRIGREASADVKPSQLDRDAEPFRPAALPPHHGVCGVLRRCG